jgi:hypothetical protein
MGDFGLWDPLLYALMRSCMIKVGKIRFEDFMQLPFIERESAGDPGILFEYSPGSAHSWHSHVEPGLAFVAP